MALPKIDVPIYDLKLYSTGEDIRYRPFLVKEEKILFMAMEGGDPVEQVSAMKQIVGNCVLDNLDVDSLPLFEIEHILLRLRSKSVNNIAKVIYQCQEDGCDGNIPVMVDLDKVELFSDESHTKKIMLTDTIGLVMKYPDLETMMKIQSSGNSVENMFSMVENCVEYIYDSQDTLNAQQKKKLFWRVWKIFSNNP
jgi:hypothetical protein